MDEKNDRVILRCQRGPRDNSKGSGAALLILEVHQNLDEKKGGVSRPSKSEEVHQNLDEEK